MKQDRCSGRFGMRSEEGEAAVAILVERIVSNLEAPVDALRVSDELNEGSALIAALHPEVYEQQVVEAVYGEVVAALAVVDPSLGA
jgi:hypothetical protein